MSIVVEFAGRSTTHRYMEDVKSLSVRAPFLVKTIERVFSTSIEITKDGNNHQARLPDDIVNVYPNGDEYCMCGSGLTREHAVADLYFRMSAGLPARHELRKKISDTDFISYSYNRALDRFCIKGAQDCSTQTLPFGRRANPA